MSARSAGLDRSPRVPATLCRWAVAVLLWGAAGGLVRAGDEWSLVAKSRVAYTTNVFQFSAARRLAFGEDPTQPTVVVIDEPSDIVVEPSAELVRRLHWRWGTTTLSFKGHGFVYTEHPVFNHATYRFEVQQTLDEKTSLLFRYRYTPNLLLGPNFERQTGLRTLQDERVTSQTWRIELERSISERWTATLVGRYGLRDYNQPFSERDTYFFTAGSRQAFAANRWLTMTGAYLYERGLAAGREQPQLMDDVSYFLHHVSVGPSLRLTRLLTLDLTYTYQRKTFTTGIPGDSRLGRVDQTNQGLAELRYQLTPSAEVALGFQQTQRTSSVTFDNFNDTLTWVSAAYAF
jgi:hypothetical protein